MFNFLEATLPSWISKVAPLNVKGCAMGVYSTSQFLGIFVGGVLGGIALHMVILLAFFNNNYGCFMVNHFNKLKEPPYLSTILIPVDEDSVQIKNPIQILNNLEGIGIVQPFLMVNFSISSTIKRKSLKRHCETFCKPVA